MMLWKFGIDLQCQLCHIKFQVLCEVPESYEAYRKQQHRWHSGPMQLFRLCLPAIVTSKVWFGARFPFLANIIYL